MIPTAEWDSASFRALPRAAPGARYLLRYLQLGPHTTSVPGLFRLGLLSAAEALDWTAAEIEGPIQQLEHAGLLRVDRAARLMFLPHAFDLDPVSSCRTVKGWSPFFREFPDCELKRTAGARLLEKLKKKDAERGVPNGKNGADGWLADAGAFLACPSDRVSSTAPDTLSDALGDSRDTPPDPTISNHHPPSTIQKPKALSAAPTIGLVAMPFGLEAPKQAALPTGQPTPAEEVFAYWQKEMNRPKASFSDERRKAVDARLAGARGGRKYSVAELKKAIDGCKASQWQQDNKGHFDDIELICRSDAKTDMFIARADQPSTAAARSKPSVYVPLTQTKERFAQAGDDDEFGLNLRPIEEENHG
jgi:hypothetical protein